VIAAANVAHGQGEPPERTEIEEKYKWDLSDIYESDEAWEKHYQELEKKIGELAKLRGTAGQSPEALLKILKLRDELEVQIDKLYSYAMQKFDQDMRQSASQALVSRARTLNVKYREATAWLEPELTNLPEEQVQQWLQRPELTIYRHYFHNLFRMKPHILPPREEELLAMASKACNAAATAYSLLTNTELRFNTIKDEQGKEITVTSPVFYDLLYSKDRRVRRDAYLALHRSYMDVKRSLAATLEGAVQRDWFYARARGYSSSLEAALDAENLPTAVYTNLIESINRHLPLLHRYVSLRKRVLGIDELHPYDLYVTLADAPEPRFSYEQAVELIVEGLEPMGPEYVDALKLGFKSRWVDVFENKGKRTGAYCNGIYLVHPYVLMNFKGNYNSVSTLAHEMGHAMQSYFANRTQPPVYAGYPMFTAEVASTAAEIVFKQYMLARTKDPKQKAMMINRMLEDIRTTVFRQTRFAEFDLLIHQMAERGEPMTAEVLMQRSRELFQKYYGPELVLDPEADAECLRIPHFYYNFYVYRYATSYCAAAAIAKRLQHDPQAVQAWMRFLKTGNSMYALDMLKLVGVDMTTSRPIEDCMKMFQELLEQLEELL